MEVRPFGIVEKDTYAGVVLEREFYVTAPRVILPDKTAEITPRFQSEEQRLAHKEAMSRKKHTRIINANFRPGDLYLTLTFDRKNECHSYEECWLLLRRYIKRLRRKYPNGKIAYYCGRGENTNRYHVHILAAGIPETFLIMKWGYGEVKDVKKLWARCMYDGVDHGADYQGLANYLFDHWEPEQGPHRYHHTRNLTMPEAEYKVCRRKYSAEHPPAAPKGYKIVEGMTEVTRYGYMRFYYVLETGDPHLDFDYETKKPRTSRKRRRRE